MSWKPMKNSDNLVHRWSPLLQKKKRKVSSKMKPEIPSAQMVMNGWADGSADKVIVILGAEAYEFLSLRVM